MIARYSRPEMAWIWNDRNKYLVWLKVEMAVCEGLAEEGLIPQKEWLQLHNKVKALIKRGGVDPKKVDEHELVTRHDVIAFTTAVAEEIGPVSRFIHFGLTSSDVLDTSLSIMLQEAGRILLEEIERLLKTLKRLAEKYKELPCIGRSHGIFAEPTSFGLKFLGWYCEWQRNYSRLHEAMENIRFGKLSGAVGVNAHWSPQLEEKILKKLNLKRELVSTQVIPRDRHAQFVNILAVLGGSIERIAIELRHLQRSEVSEVMEGFSKGQKGSSAMPHKRNPISSENMTGCVRLLRSYSQASLENIALWHERDISHSSVERVILPDATLILDYSLNRMIQVLDHLVIRADRVHENLKSAGDTVFSGHFLLELVKQGVVREQAYQWVQECSLAALEWKGAGKGDFIAQVSRHREISKILSEKKVKELASIKHQLRNVDEIFRQVDLEFKNGKSKK